MPYRSWNNKKPLSFAPRLLQTMRPTRSSSRQDAVTSSQGAPLTASPADTEKEATAPYSHPSQGREPSFNRLTYTPTTATTVVGSSSEALEIRRLSVALGDKFELPVSLLTSSESYRSAATDEAQKNTTPCSAHPGTVCPRRDGLTRSHIAGHSSQEIGPFCRQAVDETLEAHGALLPSFHLRSDESEDRGYKLNDQGGAHGGHQRDHGISRSSGSTAVEVPELGMGTLERRVTFADTTVFDHIPHREPVRPPTPPLYPHYVASVHQTPGHWDSVGAKAALQHWIADFMVFRDELKGGLKVYFNKWPEFFLFRGARKLLRATLQIPEVLKVLSADLDVLPYSGSIAIEKLDMDLRVCMEEARQVHSCMTRRNRSSAGPLQGKSLAWRKHMIKHDLGPRMEHIADNLNTLAQQTSETNRRLRKEAAEAMGQVGSAHDSVVSL